MDASLILSITRDPDDVRAAQALRHDVFASELRGDPLGGLEYDHHDGVADHVVLRDRTRPELGVVATTRLADGIGYTGQEFDMRPLLATGRPLVEVGRTCLHPDYRGGLAAMLLFRGMLDYLAQRDVGFLVGTASFHGADPARHLPALRSLRAQALAPEGLRPIAHGPEAIDTTGMAERGAMRAVPSLIKTYLRAGAWVGDGAWVDRAFDTVDVCILLDMQRLRLPERPSAGHDRSIANA